MSKVKKDFDWDLVEGKGFGGNYTTEQKEKMEAAIEATLNSVTEKEVVKGIVVSKTDREVIINIGFKSDG
jgi:small subunit ribosomal protein S1